MVGLVLWLVPLVIMAQFQHTTFAVSQCNGMTNCDKCRLKPNCFWCPELSNRRGKCMDYFNMNIASLICSNPSWKTFTCSYELNQSNDNVNRILNLIKRLEKLKQHTQATKPTISPTTQSHPAELLDLSTDKLARKLAALKEYLRKQERKEFNSNNFAVELASTPDVSEVVTQSKTTVKTLSLEEELSKDLKSFNVTEFRSTKIKTSTDSKYSTVSTPGSSTESTSKTTTLMSDAGNSYPTTKSVNWDLEWKANSVDEVKAKCSIITKEFLCNVDLNCSWCHISNTCVGRNEKDLKECFHNDKRVIEEDFGVDPCMKHVTCGTCTNTHGKCYWCEHTKSCHIYPFFGFVPHTCPTNHWYYKQCNVQFALLLFMFPLLLVLISMLMFYFCLRYCFYRKRLVKVPLFERSPGSLYEKKKGKKIYFMSGEEDEDSRAEKIRKKYQLPAEKEPLIAP